MDGIHEGVPPVAACQWAAGLQCPLLPQELIFDFLKQLGPRELLVAGQVCQLWRAAAQQDDGILWRELGEQHFGKALAAHNSGCDDFRGASRLKSLGRCFDQAFSPAEFEALRRVFTSRPPPPETHLVSAAAPDFAYWQRHFFAFGRALRLDPFRGESLRPGALMCAANEAAAATGGVATIAACSHINRCRHVIPHNRWAICSGCTRVVCDDCANDVLFGQGLARCDHCRRLFCSACDFSGTESLALLRQSWNC